MSTEEAGNALSTSSGRVCPAGSSSSLRCVCTCAELTGGGGGCSHARSACTARGKATHGLASEARSVSVRSLAAGVPLNAPQFNRECLSGGRRLQM